MIDVLILTKDEDGSVEAIELSDIEELGELQTLEAQLAVLSEVATGGAHGPVGTYIGKIQSGSA